MSGNYEQNAESFHNVKNRIPHFKDTIVDYSYKKLYYASIPIL